MKVRNLLLTILAASAAGVVARTQLNRRGAEFEPHTIVWQVTDYDESGAVVAQHT